MSVHVANFSQNPARGGKFVVLRRLGDQDAGLLLVSDFTLDSQHVDLVRRWERTAGGSMSTAGYALAGGGWWKLASPATLRLYGRSAAFGRYPVDWLKDRLPAGAVFGETEIVME